MKKPKVILEDSNLAIEETDESVRYITDDGIITIPKPKPNPIYQKAIDTFGVPAQIDMLIEEMAELTQALLKWRRGKAGPGMDNVHEEIADVEIMLAQIKTGLSQEKIDSQKNYKLSRLEGLLATHKQNPDFESHSPFFNWIGFDEPTK